MNAHTPGPWRIGLGYQPIFAYEIPTVRTDGGGHVAYAFPISGSSDCIVAAANARLIAAAPELLDALEAMYALHTGEHGPDDHANAQTNALAKAELAIDKALVK